jgi:hypothetical protein
MRDSSGTAQVLNRKEARLDGETTEPVVFDTKLVVVIRDDLESWQKLNATAFLVSGIAAGMPEVVGEPYEDGSGNRYLPMFREPVLIYGADQGDLARAARRAREREIPYAVFTQDLFATGHDAANRAAVKAVSEPDLVYVGIAFRTDRKSADKVTKGLRFHR